MTASGFTAGVFARCGVRWHDTALARSAADLALLRAPTSPASARVTGPLDGSTSGHLSHGRLPPSEKSWERVRRYITPSATAGVAKPGSPNGTRASSSNLSEAATTNTSPFFEMQ